MHKIKSDNNLNPDLRNQIQSLRSSINTGNSTKRFSKQQSDELPSIIITDNITGKMTVVALFAASDVMKALAELFPDSQ